MGKAHKLVQWDPHNIKENHCWKNILPKVARKARQADNDQRRRLENASAGDCCANVRTIPGIMTMRGCTYAGCKGVIMGPTSDIVNLVHGPIGCSFYAWLTRRNQTDGINARTQLYPLLHVHGHAGSGDYFRRRKKTGTAIQEAYDNFHPKAIAVFATCPVGLIGDDIHAVAER